MSIDAAIDKAKAVLHNPPGNEGRDPRWQAIVDVGEYLQTEPERIWKFIEELRDTQDEDLRSALATCLLEHLIEDHPHYRAKGSNARNVLVSPVCPRARNPTKLSQRGRLSLAAVFAALDTLSRAYCT